jgi:glutathione S-transferase
MLLLHDNASSGNAYKVRLLLTHLGIPFRRIEYDIDRGATRTPEFLKAKNADGRIPVLEFEGGRCLAQSNAILWYLAEGTPYLPSPATEQGRWQRAQVLQWMFFEQYSHEPNIATVRYWLTHGVEMTPDRTAALPGKRRGGQAALGVMEGHLQANPFFVGASYSIADIALYAYTHVAAEGGFDLSPFPAIERWIARVAEQPRHLKITD